MAEKHLYLLRHGIALPRGTPGVPDRDRPLTDQGRNRMVQAVKGMRKIGLTVEALWSSPLLRAYQTAQTLQKTLPFSGSIEVHEELSPGGNWEALLNKIKKQKKTHILITGHEPDLSTALESLLGCTYQGSVLMKKGALAHLELNLSKEPPQALLRYLLQPKALRRLG